VDATDAVYKKITGGDAIPIQSGTVRKMFDPEFPPTSADDLMRAVVSAGAIDNDILFSAGVNKKSLNQLNSMVAVRKQQIDKVPSYSGVIDEQTALNLLSKIYDEKKDWSATEIERYGKCPFLYLIEKVWKIQIDEEFTEEVTPLEKGSFYHDVLKHYYSGIIEGKSDNSLEGNTELMLNAIQTVTKYYKYKMRGIAPILWEMSINEAKEVLIQFVEEDQKKKNDGIFPIAVETAFGMESRKNESPFSVETPLILEYEDFSVRLELFF